MKKQCGNRAPHGPHGWGVNPVMLLALKIPIPYQCPGVKRK